MKHQLKGAWVLISGENVGWPVDRSAKGDSLRAAIKAENIEIEKQNAALMEENWSKGTKQNVSPDFTNLSGVIRIFFPHCRTKFYQ